MPQREINTLCLECQKREIPMQMEVIVLILRCPVCKAFKLCGHDTRWNPLMKPVLDVLTKQKKDFDSSFKDGKNFLK